MDYKLSIAQSVCLDGVPTQEIYDLIVQPKEADNGDFALPCFKFAKLLRKSPVAIAQQIADATVLPEGIQSVQAVNGYVNYTLDKTMLTRRVLAGVLEQGDNYGASDMGAGKTVCIDYSSVNIAKPFHMGHMLNTAIGAALDRIYTRLGYHTVGINHLGDWGTQFGKLIVAYRLWGNKEEIDRTGVKGLLDIYVRYHKEAEQDPTLDDRARAAFKAIEDNDPEAVALWHWFKDITMREVERTYQRLHVQFDSYAGESFYNDKMQPVLERLREQGLLEVSEGAQIVRLGDDMPPCLLVRADGATLYATRDLAAAFYRKQTYDFDRCLYVVAYQQNLHFRQLFGVLERMGEPWAKDMVHVAHGMVSLEDGAMSTRSGNVVTLQDVLDKAVEKALAVIEEKSPDLQDKAVVAEQVGVGAVIFSMLYNARIKDMVFSYDKCLNFDGETAPYIQYTYARCSSVLAKAQDDSVQPDYSALDNPESQAIIRLLDRYPQVLVEAARKYEPCLVSRHLVDMAQAMNKFYFEHSILQAEPAVRAARVQLVRATRHAIASALDLLGIAKPERM